MKPKEVRQMSDKETEKSSAETPAEEMLPTNEKLWEELKKLRQEVDELKKSKRTERPILPSPPHDRMIKYAPIGRSPFGLLDR